jgi:signal transduction histidine kinase/ligand-binding sensor domain-containing protein
MCAQQSELDFVFSNPVFQNYTMKNGLASNYCYDVLQDQKGYIWVATLNGLSRFNGNTWLNFQQQSKQSKYKLPANWVVDIDEDKFGNVWINTDRGIAIYHQKQDSISSFPEPIKGWGKISCTNTNQLLVSSWTGITQLQQKGHQLESTCDYTTTARNSIPFMFKDINGNSWACPEDNPSLIKINSNTKQLNYYRTINVDGENQSPVINSITQYSTDTLLLITRQNGILKYSTKNNKAYRFLKALIPDDIEFNCAVNYQIKNNNYLFVGTKKNGLYVVDLINNQVLINQYDHNNPTSILSNHITSLVVDDNQGVWIGTSAGLSFFHPSLQKNKYYYFFNNPAIPQGSFINAVYEFGNGSYLIGTDNNGLFVFNELTHKTELVNHDNSQITSFEKINNQEIVVSSNKGVYNYQITSGAYKPFVSSGKAFTYSTLKVKKLSDSLFAFCTYYGIMVYNGRTSKIIYSELSATKEKNEKQFCKDALLVNNKLWILRFFDGLEIYDFTTKKMSIPLFPELKDKPVDYHNLCKNSNDVFIATSAGIIKSNIAHNIEYKLLKTSNGLMGDEIENVCSINNNQLYYTTPEGLYNYDIKKATSQLVNTYENYPQKWFNQLSFLNSESIVYTISDYFIVNMPYLNFKNTKAPSLLIERIYVNRKEYHNSSDTIILSHKDNTITFHLGALVYPNAIKNSWYYKLNKNDTATKITTSGEIELNNLTPDDYELKIYSVNSDGQQSLYTKTIFITIQNPFYNRWWFYSLVCFGLLIIFGSLYLYRKKQQLRLTQIRNQISRDLHDELGANVSSINIMAKMLLNKHKEESNPALTNISKYSVQISDTINDIIWNVNPNFDSISELIKRMTRFASETLEAANINYSINLPDNQLNILLDNQVKYHLYLIFKEAINNSAKYSKANLVQIDIYYNTGFFSIKIKDNGIGFIESAIEKGNGLENMRARANEINAQLNISSEINNGVEITVSIKLK